MKSEQGALLQQKIETGDVTFAVIGQGYVGLPLLITFAREGFAVHGFDLDRDKIVQLESGHSYIRHILSADIDQFVAGNDRVSVTDDFARTAECDAVLICVPTPLSEHRDPDLSYIVEKLEQSAPECGSQMPTGGSMTSGELATIRSWISGGALND